MAVMAIFLHALLQGLHLFRKFSRLLLQPLDQVLLLDHDSLRVDCLLLYMYSFSQSLILLVTLKYKKNPFWALTR
jgi:hypothetical protein